MQLPPATVDPTLAWSTLSTSALRTASGTGTEPAASAAAPSPPAAAPGSSPTPVTIHPGEPWIVYQTDVGAGNVIFLMRSDGRDAHAISASAAGEELHPDWSPDGRRIAFIVDGNAIWVADADGSAATQLTACVSCDYPAWSPDGTKIAFSRYEPGSTGPSASSIEILDLASSAVTTAVREKRPLLVDLPRWSPDGKQLVVGVDQMDERGSETGAAIAVRERPNRGRRRIAHEDVLGRQPEPLGAPSRACPGTSGGADSFCTGQ